MNGIDVLLIFVVGAAIWSGWRRGFLVGALELVSWIGSLALGFVLYPSLAHFLQAHVPALGIWISPLSFLLVVMLARLLFSFIVTRLIFGYFTGFQRHTANHALGVIPGLVNGAVYATLLAALLLTLPISQSLTASAQKSFIAGKLATEAQWTNERLAPIFDDAIRRTMVKPPTEAGENETINLHFTVKDSKVREDLEAKMLNLVNEERQKQGLPALKPDPELTLVARAHATDMFVRGYFSHYTPERKDPFDRMHDAHVGFLAAGENLALGQTLLICHRGLMNSPGHRANILHRSFGRVGIGIMDGGIYGLMIAQEFRN